MTKKVIRASDYWKDSPYADLLDRGKKCLTSLVSFPEKQLVIREMMTALIQSENLIPEEEIEDREPLEGQNEMF